MKYLTILPIAILGFLAATPYNFAQGTNTAENYPSVQLSNGILDALVFLPDKDKGYYRSTRFDWSGFLAQVTCNGHTFFQNPYEKEDGPLPLIHDPLNSISGTGLSEEFREPLGYDSAAVGESFLKIGVGLLEKSGATAYSFGESYRILKPGEWKVTSGQEWIQFEQSISAESGYAYQYTKKITLLPGQPELTVLHVLKNTGTKQLISNTYCHNFFLFDLDDAGTNYIIQFVSAIEATDNYKNKASISGNSFRLLHNLTGKNAVAGYIDFGKIDEFNISNSKTGTKVFVKGDHPLASFYIYTSHQSLCPEPMIDINIIPGQKQEWTNYYRFEAE